MPDLFNSMQRLDDFERHMKEYLPVARAALPGGFQLIRLNNGRWLGLSVADVAKLMVGLQSIIDRYDVDDPDIQGYRALLERLQTL